MECKPDAYAPSRCKCSAGFPGQKHFILEIAAEDLESSEKWGTLIKIPEKVRLRRTCLHKWDLMKHLHDISLRKLHT